MKNLLSNILINWPARYLSSRTYLLLVVFYSWIFRAMGNKSALKAFHFKVEKNQIRLKFFDGMEWSIVNPVRANRYMKGVEYAGQRLLFRYRIGIPKIVPTTFVDVGANVGELSYWFARKGVSVQCFEPDPQVFDILKSNLGNFNNVSLFNVALSDFNGKARFAIQSGSADSSLVFDDTEVEQIEVQVFRFENHTASNLLEFPAILKMDTEGNEPESLLGFGALLSKFEVIAVDAGIERLGKDSKVATIEILNRNGLEVDSKDGSYMVLGLRPK